MGFIIFLFNFFVCLYGFITSSFFSFQKLGPTNTLHFVVRDVKKVKFIIKVLLIFKIIMSYNMHCIFLLFIGLLF